MKKISIKKMLPGITDEQIKESKVLVGAIKKYGGKLQSVVAIEELSELQKEISKFIRCKGDILGLKEEIADVYIVLEQLKIIYNISDYDIDSYKKFKIDKLKESIESDTPWEYDKESDSKWKLV